MFQSDFNILAPTQDWTVFSAQEQHQANAQQMLCTIKKYVYKLNKYVVLKVYDTIYIDLLNSYTSL